MADSSKTEKPTAQRRKKARDQGQIARTRELSTALAWGGAIAVLAWQVPESVRQWRGLLQSSLDISIAEPLSAGGPVMFWNAVAILRWSVPVLVTSWVFAVAGGLLQGGFTFASEALTPNIEKLSPAGKLGQMFSLAGLSGILKSLIPFSVILWIGISTIQNHWQMVVKSADLSVGAFVVFLTSALWGLCWKSGLVLVAWAGADYLFVWWKLEGDLKMSHQEVKDDSRQSDGNPEIKGRIRRMQRQMRRRQMLKDTEKASVVITNPTHFAVALRYEMDMEAPIIVAKGRDLLAQEIKDVARWHDIPIMENPPLAQALFKTVEVGRPIPAKLYTAVAEILAFVFRAQAQARQYRNGVPTR
ncbi:MAG TPA: EscU/YscU/HrcU family type III secretion system export apparatus switch protein [Terriglobales bacterium]|nr:EscU/YscU/HrcU family type III secretion system export apparatus switch protein [Terriglobales bacterium]